MNQSGEQSGDKVSAELEWSFLVTPLIIPM